MPRNNFLVSETQATERSDISDCQVVRKALPKQEIFQSGLPCSYFRVISRIGERQGGRAGFFQ
jgi:hypothetical protein